MRILFGYMDPSGLLKVCRQENYKFMSCLGISYNQCTATKDAMERQSYQFHLENAGAPSRG